MNCYVNLMVKDLLTVPKHQNTSGAVEFLYGSNVINKVEVLGTIISARNYDKKSIYDVDDSTGIIQCWQFHRSSIIDKSVEEVAKKQQLQQGNLQLVGPSTVDEITQHFAELKLDTSKCHNRGDLVWIRGKLKDFDGARSIWIDFSNNVEDANWETYFILRQVELYCRAYDCN